MRAIIQAGGLVNCGFLEANHVILNFWYEDKLYQVEAPEGSRAVTNAEGQFDGLMVTASPGGKLEAGTGIYLPCRTLIEAARRGMYGLKLVAVGTSE